MSEDATGEARPSADPCGPAPRDPLIPVDAALEAALAIAAPVAETETLPLAAATGRALAADVASPIPLPPFDQAAMDGYALRSGDLAGEGPWTLPVAGRVAAGEDARALGALPAGVAVRILTGAEPPPGFDAVERQERVARAGDAVRIAARPPAGRNIRRRGEDLAEGARILAAGAEIGPREAAALAAAGRAEVPLRRRLRVALFCTGDELRPPGTALAPGQIWNANRFALLAALAKPWIETRDLGAVADDPGALGAALGDAAGGADLIVTTGGVSVGDADHMRAVVARSGGEIRALKVAMRPGKPLAVGRVGAALYLGLPGNPVAALTCWSVIGAPAARKAAGFARLSPTPVTARAGVALERAPGRREFRPARVTGRDPEGLPVIAPLTETFSARVALLAAADGFAVLPAETSRVAEGAAIAFLPFD